SLCRRPVFSAARRPPSSPLFPYTTLFRSLSRRLDRYRLSSPTRTAVGSPEHAPLRGGRPYTSGWSHTTGFRVSRRGLLVHRHFRSEEHTSELQSRENLVCRLLLEKKKQTT